MTVTKTTNFLIIFVYDGIRAAKREIGIEKESWCGTRRDGCSGALLAASRPNQLTVSLTPQQIDNSSV